jgi:putative membrane protein
MAMTEEEKKYKGIIWTLSIIIPLAVAALFGINLPKMGYDVEPLSFLPPIYATINGLTAVCLVIAVSAIKKGNVKLHENLIKLCMVFSSLFLIMYVGYHMTSESTKFGGEGAIRYVYYFILVTHIILSIIIIPFVLFTFVRGIAGAYERHKKLARITYPMWLYVAVTGVIVYLMISPYYAH